MVLSGFIKKMLFARQFNIENGTINFLSFKKIMLPPEIIGCVKNSRETGKKLFEKEFKLIKEKYGLGEATIMQFCFNLLESYGLGAYKLLKMDGGLAFVDVKKSPFNSEGCDFISGALEGIFKLIMGDCEVKETQCISKGKSSCQFRIKKKVSEK